MLEGDTVVMKIKGVNLGNWLVLEKWMSSELFKGVDADDEEDFYAMLSSDEAALRIRMHRDYFIQERDFQHMKTMGLNLVRIPVPHFIFGEKKPYVGCIEYLDKAFDWGEKYGQEWEDFMREPEYKNVVIDTHMYVGGLESHMESREMADYAREIEENFEKALERAQQFHSVIVGEWCIANKSAHIKDADDEEKKRIYRMISDMELKAWDKCDGWIFWSYKLHTPGRNDRDFERAVDAGWLVL